MLISLVLERLTIEKVAPFRYVMVCGVWCAMATGCLCLFFQFVCYLKMYAFTVILWLFSDNNFYFIVSPYCAMGEVISVYIYLYALVEHSRRDFYDEPWRVFVALWLIIIIFPLWFDVSLATKWEMVGYRKIEKIRQMATQCKWPAAEALYRMDIWNLKINIRFILLIQSIQMIEIYNIGIC